MNIKMDTSLENALPGSNEQSMLSPCSVSSDSRNSERGSCHHNKLVSQENYDTCFHCGTYVSKNGTKTFKSKKMNYVAFFPVKTIYETMTRKSNQFRQSLNPEYSQIRQTYVEWVLELADKLKISANSSHLAIYLLDTIMYRDTSLTSKLQLYAPVCLLIAAKTMELDERIPFIPKLRRYANPTFSIDDYRRAELQVLDMVDWNAQFSPALEINEFLMCQGVLFSTDEIEDNISFNEGGKWSPEGLRENTQHENINHRAESEKKESHKILLSPAYKENNENSYSDISTNGTNTDNAGIYTPAEECSPTKHTIPIFLKQHSTPAHFEARHSAARAGTSIEKKVGEIMTHFETSHVKLSTLLLKDIDFIEWEPKVISAAMMAFFRCVNRITPIWNSDLEAITGLKFQQISSCFDLTYKKYSAAFNTHTTKLHNVLQNLDNQKDLSPVLRIKAQTNLSDKSPAHAQPKLELSNKTNNINTNSNKPTAHNDSNIIDQKPFERKPIFTYQPKSIPAANPSTAASYNHLRDDLRFRTKYPGGTINTELPQRHPSKNTIFPSNYQSNKYSVGQDYLVSHYNNTNAMSSGTSGVSTAAGSYSAVGNQTSAQNNPSGSYLPNKANPSFENVLPYQSKLTMLKK